MAVLRLGIGVKITQSLGMLKVSMRIYPRTKEPSNTLLPCNRFAQRHGGSSEGEWRQDNGFDLCLMSTLPLAMTTLELKSGVVPTTDQLAYLRAQLGADLVIVGNILNYGKIRWQYWVRGLLLSMLTETLIVGAQQDLIRSSWRRLLEVNC